MDRKSQDTPAIQVRNIKKSYGRTHALNGINFDIHRNELFALLGPNGAGKTTMLNILSTITRPDEGKALIGGIDAARRPLHARRQLGIVFQDPSLDDRLSVYENLNLHGLVFGVPRKLRQQRIEEMLDLVELSDWVDKTARALSSGMKRRLEIARALIHDSDILLLDEPTVGLDAQTRNRIWKYIHQLRERREMTVLVTTHYIEEVEGCDRICVIDRGEILALDTPTELKRIHGEQYLRITLRDENTTAEIAKKYHDRIIDHKSEASQQIILKSDAVFVELFLAEYGSRLRSLVNEVASLETVFLNLTGKDLRDQVAGIRERTRSFGKRGGEHTK